jgi:hypothetical protein
MARSLLVVCLFFAGIWQVASLGWALIAAGFLVFILWRQEPDWRAVVIRAQGAVARVAARLRAAPRPSTAVTGMMAAVVLLPLGFGLAVGAGWALVAGGVSLAGVSLLTGWGA